MGTQVVGTMLLRCTVGRSDKEYKVEIVQEDPLFNSGQHRSITARYGPSGKLANEKSYGVYTWDRLEKLLVSKLNKGYEIQNVDGKPFGSGSVYDAMALMVGDKNWDQLMTAQPVQAIQAVDVQVTFDEGQIAPVW